MKRIRLGLAGLGNVGRGFLEILEREQDILLARTGLKFIVTRIFDRSWEKKKQFTGNIPASADFTDLVSDDNVDIIIELLGGMDPAKEIITSGLLAKKPVVTANKALLAKHGNEILAIAHKSKTDIAFEAAIAGALPIIKTMRRSLVANQFSHIYAILNGTCNFIITKMEDEAMDYQDALKQAQEKGFAEADPSFDVNGHDAAQKLAILSALTFDISINEDAVLVEGICSLNSLDLENAKDMGMVVRLLAIAKNNPVQMKVRPVMIPRSHILASVKNEKNAIYLLANNSGPHLVMGSGAGAAPTAAAVISDLVYLGKKNSNQTEYWISGKKVPELYNDYHSRYYLRFLTHDRPGVLAELAEILAKSNISIASVHQNEGREIVNLVIITHTASEIKLKEAIHKINQKEFIKAKATVIQIEENIPE